MSQRCLLVLAVVLLPPIVWSAEKGDWWSFQPLAKTVPPAIDEVSHPIDRFLLARAQKQQLAFSPAASPQALIRRAYLDLVGLPPSPEAVARFVAAAPPQGWSELIDELLASPHYGERWARHWLDVARFAESSGFEHDYDREGAFHYRDFVIKAFNRDLPYDQFVRWQLAGDEFEPDNALALSATGFLGAGVFPTQITANEVERTRYDALDDMLSTSSQAFLGLTVGCARCHDHKYDPISNRDYYQMLSTFTTTVRSVVDLDLEPEQTRQRLSEWETARTKLLQALARSEGQLRKPFQEWLKKVDLSALPGWVELELTNVASQAGATFRRLDTGALLVEGKNADSDQYTLTAKVDHPVNAIRLDALAHSSLVRGGPGRAENGNIGLSRIHVLVEGQTGEVEVALKNARADFEQNAKNLAVKGALDEDPHTGWAIDPQFGKDHSAAFDLAQPVTGRITVRLDFQLNTRHNLGCFRLSASAANSPSLEGAPLPETIAHLFAQASPARSWNEAETEELFVWWVRSQPEWQAHQARLLAHEKVKPNGKTKVLVCAEGYDPLRMHTQGADFFPETYFLKRGDTGLKDGVASQNFLPTLMREPFDHWREQAPAGTRFSGRRAALARWLTDADTGAGALLARVMVNRLWQHHFGQGLVSTPNDFGHTGVASTHPELLDWLAGELIRGGWKLKPLHRLIMTSGAYQQACLADEPRARADPNNALWMRRLPRRLEGETIRDCLLAVSGQLDPALYGAGTRDEQSKRRSIYFTIKRSQLVGSMVAFDQPEPLVSQGQRPVTTVAPQALLLMNGKQVRDWAQAFAKRIAAESSGSSEARVQRAYLLALGRSPDKRETSEAIAFVESQAAAYGSAGPDEQAWADLCQVIFGLNEFVYEP